MIQEIKTHGLAYTVLLFALVLYVIAFLAAWPNHVAQRIIAVGMGATYTAWGILTHFKTNQVTSKVIFEYSMIGLLASVLLILVTV